MAKKAALAPSESAPESEPPKAAERPEKPRKQKRYDVSLARPEDPACFVVFHETDSRAEAERKCVDKACDEDRECIVWDNDTSDHPIVFRHGKKEVVKDDPPPASKPRAKHQPAIQRRR